MRSYRLEHFVDDSIMASVRFARASDDGARLAVILTASRIGLFVDQAINQTLTLSRECGAPLFSMTNMSLKPDMLHSHG